MQDDLLVIAKDFVIQEAPSEEELVGVFGKSVMEARADLTLDEDTKGETFGFEADSVAYVALVLLGWVGGEAAAAGKVITYSLLIDFLKSTTRQLTALETRLHGKCTVLPNLEKFVRSRAKP
jgi:hypothetical protein